MCLAVKMALAVACWPVLKLAGTDVTQPFHFM